MGVSFDKGARALVCARGGSRGFVGIGAAMEGASNRLIDAEDLTEEELETLHKH